MAGLPLLRSKPFLQGCTLALFFAIASSPPPAAAQVSPAADAAGTRVLVNGNEFTITDGKLSGANQFHSFDRFDLNSSQSARFQSPAQVKNILGRISGASPSMIDGLIRVSGANANLYLINPSGISFGPNARLDLPGSFHASTAQAIRLGDSWFRASGTNAYEALGGSPNAFAFLHNNPGSIINAGHLQVPAGETITLMGGTVINSGTITAQGGTVNLLAVGGAKLVEVGASQQLLSLALPAADQQAIADGLQPLTAASLPALLTGGSISHATTIEVEADGTVRLRGSGAVVPSSPGVVVASGTLDASGKGNGQEVGGLVRVLGQEVGLDHATIDVSGTKGGGTAHIGGDFKGQGPLPTARRTTVDGGSTIRADAIEAGQGGNVVIWADGQTLFQGQVSAKGGQTSGDGGLVEISGKSSLRYYGQVKTSAPQGNTGTLLLDPANIQIVPGSGATNDAVLDAKKSILAADPPDDTMVISESKIEQESKNNYLVFQASQQITIDNLQGVASGSLFNGVLDLTKGIQFIAGAGGFQMDGSNTIKITELSSGLTISSPNGPIKLGNIQTNAGDTRIEGSHIEQPANGTISTNQGNLTAKSLESIKLGRIKTNNSDDTKASIEINVNKDGKYGNIELKSTNGSILVSSIDTSNEYDNGSNDANLRNGRGRAGNVTVDAEKGTFRVTSTFTDSNGKANVSISSTGKSEADDTFKLDANSEAQNFSKTGIGKITITANSSVDYFVAGASAVSTPNLQASDVVINDTNRALFLSDSSISGSLGAVIGFSTNSLLESVISDKGVSNTDPSGATLFTLNISRFSPPSTENPNGDSGSGMIRPGGSNTVVRNGAGSNPAPEISTTLDRQDLSNTKQLDQTASTTECADERKKECRKELDEGTIPILDVSAFK